MSDYINEGSEIFDEQKSKKFGVGKVFKWIMLLIIIFVYGVLFARCMVSRDHKIVNEIIRDEIFQAALVENRDTFTVEKYAMQSAWVAIRDNRLIEFDQLNYIPLAKQMQFAVKFSTDLPECEYDEQIPFKFRLMDENGNEYTDYWYKYASRSRFGFVRVCFNGIDFEIDGEYDENGKAKRHRYTLYIDMVDQNGEYSELCNYKIYDGSSVYKNIDFE